MLSPLRKSAMNMIARSGWILACFLVTSWLSATSFEGGLQVATPAAAWPNPVTLTTTTLSVLGSDPGGAASLIYTWETTGVTPSLVVFSTTNGTNAAKNCLVTFQRAGTYSFLVTIANTSGNTVTSAVTVTVSQTLKSIIVNPSLPSVVDGQVLGFTACGIDQFGEPVSGPPTWTWTATAGSITPEGLFTAPLSGTTNATVKATSGSIYGQTTVSVTNAAPWVTTGAAGASGHVHGTATTLSVSADDDGGETNLTYTWSVLGVPPAPIGFSPNGTHAARCTSASFTKSGAYACQVSIADQAGRTVTSAVTVIVDQELMDIVVAPSLVSVPVSASQTFTATGRDQFGDLMIVQPDVTWTSPGGGTVDATGTFVAGIAPGGPFAVAAGVGAVVGSAQVSVVNTPPTIAVPAAVATSPVTDTVGRVSVSAADDGGEDHLIYTWSAVGSPPAPVAFAPNGTHDARSSTARFSSSGSYDLQVTITDAAGLTVISPLTVAVGSTPITISITPQTVVIPIGLTDQFAASALDQFGMVMTPQPSMTWSAYGGVVSPTGLFTAGRTVDGPYLITASAGGAVGSAQITVVNAAPTIVTPATAASPVLGTTTTVSVLGADDGGEANLVYTWSVLGSPPAPVGFAVNGTHAAQSTVLSFSRSGNYDLRATVSDANGLSVTSQVSVVVAQTHTATQVVPTIAGVVVGCSQVFVATALDQFGSVLAAQPDFSWSTTGGGAISGSGVFTAGGTPGGPYAISAAANGHAGSSVVAISSQSPPIASVHADPWNATYPTRVTLNAGSSTDPNGLALNYTWTDYGGNTLSTTSSLTTTISASGTTWILLTVSDGSLSTTQAIPVIHATTPMAINATDHSLDGGVLIVDHATVTLDGSHGYMAGRVVNSGVLTASPYAVSGGGTGLNVQFQDDLTIASNGVVTANGTGCPRGTTWSTTLGITTADAATGRAGGSHGGYGADSTSSAAIVPAATNEVYDDFESPSQPGAGAGLGSDNPGTACVGGGVIRISAGSLVNSGKVSADGQNGSASYVGGGAGGSIWVDITGSYQGTGTITATGGTAGASSGPGGGGRIAVYYGLGTLDLTKVTAYAGGPYAGQGSVYVKLATNASPTLKMQNVNGTGRMTPLWFGIRHDDSDDPVTYPCEMVFQTANMVVESGVTTLRLVGAANQLGGGMLQADRLSATNLEVKATHVLQPFPTDVGNPHMLLLTVDGLLLVDSGGSITVSGCGYPRGASPVGGPSGRSGGSHGGYGADTLTSTAIAPAASNEVYDDFADPHFAGAGAGLGVDNAGVASYGGGVLRIVVGSMTQNGTISANGQNGSASYVGGGAGGSIRIDVAGVYQGTGTITATGGTAGISTGPGGGGRIAVYYGSGTLDPTKLMAYAGGSYAGQGSVYIRLATNALPILKMQNVNSTGRMTPLWFGVRHDDSDDPVTYPCEIIFQTANMVMESSLTTLRLAGAANQLGSGRLQTDRLSATNLEVKVSHILQPYPTDASGPHMLSLTVDGLLQVDAGGTITASGCGYPRGVSLMGGASGRSGGSHGGYGADSSTLAAITPATTNEVYDDFADPHFAGAGAGIGVDNAGVASYGGGVLRIVVGSMTQNGTISANGQNGSAAYVGGGAGGSIRIDVADAYQGVGVVTATGGNGYSAANTGPGGGGRIAIYYGTGTLDLTKLTAYGGTYAGQGSVYVKLATNASPTLKMQNASLATGRMTPLWFGVRYDDSDDPVTYPCEMIFQSANMVVESNVTTLRLIGAANQLGSGTLQTGHLSATNLEVKVSHVLQPYPTDASGPHMLSLTVDGLLQVDAGGTITASGRGYPRGASLMGGASGRSGGSHGGYGADSSTSATITPATTNEVYDDFADPHFAGAGAGLGADNADVASSGGGVLRIAAGSLTQNGTISANGQNGSAAYVGGGAGGSIRIDVADAYQGVGVVTATGGNGNSTANTGAGGGGRIAIYYGTGTLDLTKLTAYGGTSAGPGSVYVKLATNASPTLKMQNASVATGRMTPLWFGARYDDSDDPVTYPCEMVFQTANMVVESDVTTLRLIGAANQLGNGTLQTDRLSATNLEIKASHILQPLTTDANGPHTLTLSVDGLLLVDTSGVISATGCGYPRGISVGNVSVGAGVGRSGGSHGGYGADSSTLATITPATTNEVYDDFADPHFAGAGAGLGADNTDAASSGGGVLRIAAGSLTQNGTISANGQSGSAAYVGGGAGGSIRIDVAGAYQGVGVVTATGGNGYSSANAGPGGGGRIAIYYGSGSPDVTKITTFGGSSGGGCGSVYLRLATDAQPMLSFRNAVITGKCTPLWFGQRSDAGDDPVVYPCFFSMLHANVTVESEVTTLRCVGVSNQLGSGCLQIDRLSATNLELLSGHTLQPIPMTSVEAHALTLTVDGNLTIDAGASISSTGLGYLRGRTVGNILVGGATGRSGGSHGGWGVDTGVYPTWSPATTNKVYGDLTDPSQPGAGGGFGQDAPQAPAGGGGVLRIAAGTFVNNGAVHADGQGPNVNYVGAGAGGSVRLDIGTSQTLGVVSANGGSSFYGGGGGGGGRIAIYYDTGTISMANLTSIGVDANAGPGTIYIRQRNAAAGDLYIAGPVQGNPLPTWVFYGNPTAILLSQPSCPEDFVIHDLNSATHLVVGDTAAFDADHDGLSAWIEIGLGTNPRQRDSNGDGIDDGASISAGIDPLAPHAPFGYPPTPDPTPGDVTPPHVMVDQPADAVVTP